MKRELMKDIARQRIEVLFREAESVFRRDPELANEYVRLALRIAKRARVRIPRECRYRVCKYCKSFLWPGVNAVVRIRQRRSPHVVIKCLVCGRIRRIPYK